MGPSLFPPPWLAESAAGADFLKSALATTTNPAKLSQATSYKLTLAVHSPGLILGLARNGPPAVLGPTPPQAPIFLATNVNMAISALRNLQRYSVDVFASINSASEVVVHVCSRAQRAIASDVICMQIRCLWIHMARVCAARNPPAGYHSDFEPVAHFRGLARRRRRKKSGRFEHIQ